MGVARATPFSFSSMYVTVVVAQTTTLSLHERVRGRAVGAALPRLRFAPGDSRPRGRTTRLFLKCGALPCHRGGGPLDPPPACSQPSSFQRLARIEESGARPRGPPPTRSTESGPA